MRCAFDCGGCVGVAGEVVAEEGAGGGGRAMVYLVVMRV